MGSKTVETEKFRSVVLNPLTTMKTNDLQELLDKNRDWAAEITARDPEFFNSLAQQQTPRYLWIGCSDSRVPATQLVGLKPGDMFVHRNVANVVVHTDFNCLSVLQFAVDVLKVEHVIVCGHYGCGGVKAAMDNLSLGLIDNWLRHVQDVMHSNDEIMTTITDDSLRLDKLCELNVAAQVLSVSRTTIVQSAWARGQELAIHGWIYGIGDGRLRDLGISATQSELTKAFER
jgi:carbonic anhydrase